MLCKIKLLGRYTDRLKKIIKNEMPPILAKCKDDQGHKDKYLDTNRNICILLEEMLMCNMKALALTVKK